MPKPQRTTLPDWLAYLEQSHPKSIDLGLERVARVKDALGQCGANVRSAVRIGHPVQEILLAAKEHDADLIAIGARGQTQTETFRLGGVAQKVVKYAPCSVLVGR